MTLFLSILVFAVALGAGLTMLRRIAGESEEVFLRAAESCGLSPDQTTPAAEMRQPDDPLLNLRGATMSRHLRGRLQGGAVRLLQHDHELRVNGRRRVISHRIAIVPMSQAWGEVRIDPVRARRERRQRVCPGRPTFECARFNERFTVTTVDDDFALLLLVPGLQEWIAAGPRCRSWRLKGGQLLLIEGGPLRAEDLMPMVSAVEEFLARIPPDLLALSEHPTMTPGFRNSA